MPKNNVKIQGKTFVTEWISNSEVNISGDILECVILNNQNGIYTIKVGPKVTRLYCKRKFDSNYEIWIKEKILNVELEDPKSKLLATYQKTSKHSAKVTVVTAPMPGLIIDVHVLEGKHVKKGDYLVTLEAMKMENNILAPMDGMVKSIAIRKGMAIEKDQKLLIIESV